MSIRLRSTAACDISCFSMNLQALWDPEKRIAGADSSTASLAAQSKILPKATQVGVHAGFDDLYTRRVRKVVDNQQVSVPSPREVSRGGGGGGGAVLDCNVCVCGNGCVR
jgi:hypothetical protein